MKSKLSRLKESFGEATVMLNVVDPVSKYYCEKDILRTEDEPIFKHLEVCDGITPHIGSDIINAIYPSYKAPLSGDACAKWLNDLCRVISSCLGDSISIDRSSGQPVISIQTEDALEYFGGGIGHVVSENPATFPLYEAVDTDNLADNVLSDQEILLLMQLAQPNKHRSYNQSQRDIVKKELKNKNSSIYRVLSGNYLKENEEINQDEAIKEMGVEAIAEAQKKSIALTESNNCINICTVGEKGYNIVKLKV